MPLREDDPRLIIVVTKVLPLRLATPLPASYILREKTTNRVRKSETATWDSQKNAPRGLKFPDAS